MIFRDAVKSAASKQCYKALAKMLYILQLVLAWLVAASSALVPGPAAAMERLSLSRAPAELS